MNTYIALLRGINVAGQKKIKMVTLKKLCEDMGFTAVTTYIQSGNIVFKSQKTDVTVLSQFISTGIQQQFGFEVPVLVLTHDTLADIYNNNPFAHRITIGEIDSKKMYFTLLSTPPDPHAKKEITVNSQEGEEFVITDKVVYFYAGIGYGKTKLSNNFFEKKLQTQATTRNLKTVLKLLDLSI